MITEDEFLQAVQTVESYRRQINEMADGITLPRLLEPIANADISPRLYNNLVGYFNQKDIRNPRLGDLSLISEMEICSARNFGSKSAEELYELCKHVGVNLKP